MLCMLLLMKLIIFGKVSEEELADRELLIELVLNGIGGSTLAEAELNISHKELMEWRAYRQKYGSFFGRRLEQSFGSWMALTGFKVREGTPKWILIFICLMSNHLKKSQFRFS